VQGQDKVGTSAGAFLGIAVGGAGTAMGGAYTSFARDASSLYWNPGAISRVGNSSVGFMHSNWLVDTDLSWAGIILNLGNGFALGAQAAMLSTGEEDVTRDDSGGTGEKWDANLSYVTFNIAKNLTDRFSIGGAVKIVHEQIYHETATGYALDVGLLYITRFNGLRLGMSISNFGSKMQLDGKDLTVPYDPDEDALGNNPNITAKLKTGEWPLPLFFRVGVSMEALEFSGNVITLAADAVVPTDNTTIINLGMEYGFNEIFYLRAGYKSLMRAETQEGLTAGLGFRYHVPELSKIHMEYSFNEFGIIGDVHSLGFGFDF
jgi:long-subunit fatty acid transport protein